MLSLCQRTSFIFLLMTLALVSFGQVKHAGAMRFRVVTDTGEPVPDVNVTASIFSHWEPGQGFGRDVHDDFKVKTDGKGVAIFGFSTERPECRYGIYDVPGYYSTRNLAYKFDKPKLGRLEPWEPLVEVVLKPIVKPIPLYARRVGTPVKRVEIPVSNQPAGFDLMAGDWVAPYGRGSQADLIFTLKPIVPLVNVGEPFMYKFDATFSGAGDGIQLVPENQISASDLRMPRSAPVEGYRDRLEKSIGRAAKGAKIDKADGDKSGYFFRIRTQLDRNGNVVSALYGKISGSLLCDVLGSKNGRLYFTYYLNPTSNDRNLEFSPAQNLFKNLDTWEVVSAP